MDSRERVFLTLRHEAADRTPFDFWASSGAWTMIETAAGISREEFLDRHDVDFRYITGPEYTGPELPPDTDMWRVKRRKVAVPTPHGIDYYMENDDFPLAGLPDAEAVLAWDGWPSPDDFDYSGVKAQAQAVRDKGRVSVFMGDRLNRIAQLKPAMYMRGVDRILLDLALDPELALAIFRKLADFYSEYLARILDAADGTIDIVLTGDDFGQQKGTLMSDAMWRQFIEPGFRRFMDVIRAGGAVSMHHTCGDVRSLVGRMGEMGLDVLQSLQPESMEDFFPEMKRLYGGNMSFQGGISIQRTMPHGTPDDIRAEVRRRISELGSEGGYILCTAHNVQTDCPMENILALLAAYSEVGARK